ncbi:MAG: ABC transporter ATP-binding protein [Rhodospirillaceae bacterium]|nr:ABC transporter ATP-binding protein [Rhodospirillaceae bacterium]
MLLEVQGLTSHYGRIQALKGVDLAIAEGELVALVGANGAGKTTLLRTLSGVQPATGGSIAYAGCDITRLVPHRRVRLGIAQVPEGRQVFGPMSVEDNLRLGAFTGSRQTVEADLEAQYTRFPILKERRAQAAGTLSGGQQQMLAIARALMARPKLLLLDEPSMGLAPLITQQILAAVRSFRDDGMTVFLVEQNAFAALTIADRGYVMETGRIVLHGPARDLLADDDVKRAYLGV